MPGHADGAVTIHLGYGRRAAGRVGGSASHTVGFDAFALRSSTDPWFAADLKIVPTGSHFPLACTQAHHSLGDRDIVRSGTLAEFRANPHRWKAPPNEKHPSTQRPSLPTTIYATTEDGHPRHQWGMVIDMTACTGCSACVVACQAENNIPVVGKTEVTRGREMHWLRVDRYYNGTPEAPITHFQP